MAMTAAHKTLPLPSVARVTSLITGKSIVVVIDDRGPYVYKGRIIDLSYGAAVALGIHGRKPSMVRVEVLVEDSLKLSRYAALCRRNKGIRRGRSLCQVYFEDVKGMPMPIPPIYTASHTQRLERKRSGISTRQQHPSSKRNSHSGPRKSLQAHIDHIRA
jgi:rare lipoprotein A (peptidoglycan hydrolase)